MLKHFKGLQKVLRPPGVRAHLLIQKDASIAHPSMRFQVYDTVRDLSLEGDISLCIIKRNVGNLNKKYKLMFNLTPSS